MKPACPSCERGELNFVKNIHTKREYYVPLYECSQCQSVFKEDKRKIILLSPDEVLQDEEVLTSQTGILPDEIPICPHCGGTLPPAKKKKIMGFEIPEFYCKKCDLDFYEEDIH